MLLANERARNKRRKHRKYEMSEAYREKERERSRNYQRAKRLLNSDPRLPANYKEKLHELFAKCESRGLLQTRAAEYFTGRVLQAQKEIPKTILASLHVLGQLLDAPPNSKPVSQKRLMDLLKNAPVDGRELQGES